MKFLRTSIFGALLGIATITSAAVTTPGFGTTVAVSAELATSMAANGFPVTIDLSAGKLFLTQPTVVYSDGTRITVQVQFQAYDHRPEQGIAVSEKGNATVSGGLSFDRETRQVLLENPRLDSIRFDRENASARTFLAQIQSAWSTQVSNPMRTEIPPHPYLVPFKQNIQDIAYDGKNINLKIVYE